MPAQENTPSLLGGSRAWRYRRAVDLILPPLSGALVTEFIMKNNTPSEITKDIVQNRRTGCLRSNNETVGSRAALLLFEGRVVGCIYSSKKLGEQQPTEPSLVLVLSQLALPETTVQLYDLPESMILPLSAIFLGKQTHRSDDLDARSYLEYMLSWLGQREQTACLIFNTAPDESILVFIFKGNYAGSFQVQSQAYSDDLETVYKLLEIHPDATVATSILGHEVIMSQEPLGFSLE